MMQGLWAKPTLFFALFLVQFAHGGGRVPVQEVFAANLRFTIRMSRVESPTPRRNIVQTL
jgi:hypothetical protein